MVSPSWTSRARLPRSPLTSTFPPSTAWAAAERVLKKRAAHNHLSRRTRKGNPAVGAVAEVAEVVGSDTGSILRGSARLGMLGVNRSQRIVDTAPLLPEYGA